MQKIANPTTIVNPVEKQQYTQLKQTLMQESAKGNQLASSILSVSNTLVSSTHVSTQVIQQLQQNTQLQQTLQQESTKGNQLATTLLQVATNKQMDITQVNSVMQKLQEAKKNGDPIATSVLSTVDKQQEQNLEQVTTVIKQLEEGKKKGDPIASAVLSTIQKQQAQQIQGVSPASPLPTVNRVQAVSLDDYEAVKKMWKENYQKLEPPAGRDRKEWVTSDQKRIEETINLLSSVDTEKEKQGMQMVGNILPFLLIGGFSKTEIIAYLKAKQEAGKDMLEDIKTKTEEEETKLGVEHKETAKAQEMHAEMPEENDADSPETEEKKDNEPENPQS